MAVAALIAVFAWLLLQQAERSREAAVLAGAAFRDMIAATTARNDFVQAPPRNRNAHALQARQSAERAQDALSRLGLLAESGEEAAVVAAAQRAAGRHTGRMDELVRATAESDARVEGMGRQETTLLALTDQARKRQHTSNVSLTVSLSEADRRLRTGREVVDRLQELRVALLQAQLILRGEAAGVRPQRGLPVALDRLGRTLESLQAAMLGAIDPEDPAAVLPSGDIYKAAMAELTALRTVPLDRATLGDLAPRFEALAERVLKVANTGYNAVQDEVAELLLYSVSAKDIEQETQNVAVAALTLSARTADALSGRDTGALTTVAAESAGLWQRVAGLPISPMIQDEMLAAIAAWREGLERTITALVRQNEAIAAMDADAAAIMDTAWRLNDLFQESAERSAGLLRTTLVFGATIGLLLAAGTALLVARSITRPVRRLQRTALRLARDPRDGRITDLHRGDELGDMARAVHHFVGEIVRREDDLRRAKGQADAALDKLRQTQGHLIQAAKLASLGQMVAGVAHEINTPLGIALTTSTLMKDKVPRIAALVQSGQLRRRELERFLDDMGDIADLLVNNTVRAAELVHRFKQLADNPSRAEHSHFDLKACLEEVVRGLEPSWKPAGHQVRLDCPDGLWLDGYPRAIEQIAAQLLSNAFVHGCGPDGRGSVLLTATLVSAHTLELACADDGPGIPAEDHDRVFDPFFTTRRDLGHAGLGLHIVYNTVSQLGGSVALRSAPRRGTSVFVRLPAAATAALPPPETAAQRDGGTGMMEEPA